MKGFLGIALLISVLINIVIIGGLFVVEKVPPKPPENDNKPLILSIATICGVEDVEKKNSRELLVDIQIKLNNSEKYYGEQLSEDDMKKVTMYLYDKEQVVKKIKEHEKFLAKIAGKKIVILADRDGESQ